MELTSLAFQGNSPLPADYTCRGRGVSPPLKISDVPEGTQSLALIMHDPDAVGSDFLHWSAWNIPPKTADIDEGRLPAGAVQGMSDGQNTAYSPACPPPATGLHHYIFELYALDTVLDLPAGASRQELEGAMNGHTLATAQLTGTVQS